MIEVHFHCTARDHCARPPAGERGSGALPKHSVAQATYEEHQLRPGDSGYEYDKRVEFTVSNEPNEWDDELEDVESEIDEIDELLRGL